MEYASVVFHSLLTQAQSFALERLQSIALKTIHGWHKSYRECRTLSGLSTLEDRRHKATLAFANKCADSDRFGHWFPERERSRYDLRGREKYTIEFARHERLRNAPIHYMRRLLNDQVAYEGDAFGDLDG